MHDDEDLGWITTELARAAVSERAPAALRLQIDGLPRRQRASPRRPVRRWLLVPAAGALAAVVLALVLFLPGGGGSGAGGPTIAQAAAVSAVPIVYAPFPHEAATAAATKAYATFADVRFPAGLRLWDFEGWRIVSLDGRRLLTIYYAHRDDEIFFTVGAAPRLRGQRSGYSSFTRNGRVVVSWPESDHSCLLTSATASRARLEALARS